MMIRTTPITWFEPSLAAASAIALTPRNPIGIPSSCRGPGGCRSMIVAITAVQIGAAPFSIPAIAEFTDPCAIGNSVSGITTQVRATTRIAARSSGWIVARRAAGNSQIAAAPNRTRSQVISPGRNASNPIAWNRKDAPQIDPTTRNSAQSTPVYAPRWVPCEVVRTRVVISEQRPTSVDREIVRPRVAAGALLVDLHQDVVQERRGADPEPIRRHPLGAEGLVQQDEVLD